MFDAEWYLKHFAPLVAEADSKGIKTPERFIEWINSNKDRKSKHAGIEYFVRDIEDWAEVVKECNALV